MKHYQSKAILGIPGTSLDQMVVSVAKFANFWLMQESRTSAGYLFSISSCFILSSCGLNLVQWVAPWVRHWQTSLLAFMKVDFLTTPQNQVSTFIMWTIVLSSLVPSWIVTIYKKNSTCYIQL